MNSDEKLDKILQKFDDHARDTKEELATIKRGIYGDPQNKVLGLIDTDKAQDKQLQNQHMRIADLEETHKKAKWTVAGFSAAVSLLGAIVWHFLKEKLGL